MNDRLTDARDAAQAVRLRKAMPLPANAKGRLRFGYLPRMRSISACTT